MFVVGLGFLVLFVAISVMLDKEDPRRATDPRTTLALWERFSGR